MQNRTSRVEQRSQQGGLTLGDVIYAQSRAPVSEERWATLVQSIAAKDEHALHALYEMTHRLVFTLIMRMTSDRQIAEDLTIDVFHDVWLNASHYDATDGTVLGWILNQARSRAIDFQKRERRSHNIDSHTNVAANPRGTLDRREQSKLPAVALAALAPEERHALEMIFFAGLTHSEAATRLNQPVRMIKAHIRSGLHNLRRALNAAAENA